MGFMSLLGAGLPPVVSSFSYDAVTFDGTNDSLARGAALTGAADAATAIFSLWIKETAVQNVFASQTQALNLGINTGAAPTFTDATGLNGVVIVGTTPVNNGNWHHVLGAFNTGTATYQLYIDDVVDGATPIVLGIPANFSFTDTNFFFGDIPGGGGRLNADVAEFYLTNTFLDLSVTANRRKFITAGLKPVDLGSDGSTPTGVKPLIYLHAPTGGPASQFGTNAGSGGGMTTTGALTLAATKP